MNQHTRIAKASDGLYEAFKARFLASPRLANELITGEGTWPPAYGADHLWGEAVDLVKDREELAMETGASLDTTKLIEIRACRDALAILANAETDRREAEEAAYENRGRSTSGGYYANV